MYGSPATTAFAPAMVSEPRARKLTISRLVTQLSLSQPTGKSSRQVASLFFFLHSRQSFCCFALLSSDIFNPPPAGLPRHTHLSSSFLSARLTHQSCLHFAGPAR